MSSKKRKAAPVAKKPAARTAVAPGSAALSSEQQKFINDLIIRGDAAKPLPDGSLPPDATHEIVESEDGKVPPPPVRRRFSIA